MEVLMTKSKTIRVTPNMKKCLEILSKAVKSMPKSELKQQSKAAIDYMSKTFEGEPQPSKGRKCLPPYFVVPS